MRVAIKRRNRTIYLLYTSALAIGVIAAFLVSGNIGTTSRVNAAVHCTNYFPQYQTPDTNCGHNYLIPSSPGNGDSIWGQTPGREYRDSNQIIVAYSRVLEIWYGEAVYAWGSGKTISLDNPSPGKQAAGCGMVGRGVYGHCFTVWHN